MTRTTIMLEEDTKRRAMAEARKLNVSFAGFVRQAISEKLPRRGKGVDRLQRRREDPLFRLLDRLPLADDVAATDVALRHDDSSWPATSSGRGCESSSSLGLALRTLWS